MKENKYLEIARKMKEIEIKDLAKNLECRHREIIDSTYRFLNDNSNEIKIVEFNYQKISNIFGGDEFFISEIINEIIDTFGEFIHDVILYQFESEIEYEGLSQYCSLFKITYAKDGVICIDNLIFKVDGDK